MTHFPFSRYTSQNRGPPTTPKRKDETMERFSALIGFVLILAIAFALSNNKRAIRWRTVAWGLLLQIFIAIAVLKGEPISRAIVGANPPISQTWAAVIFIVAAVIDVGRPIGSTVDL